jgi:VWFA-related protein
MRSSVLCCLLLCVAAVSVFAQEAERKKDPRDLPASTDLVESVAIELAEVRILVTDRRGAGIVDLDESEIQVFEGGVQQEIAFVERVGVTQGVGLHEQSPTPAVVYTQDGEMVATEDADVVAPTKPIRRVILAFDTRNSKLNIRDKWVAAAEDWVRDEMRDDDMVAVVSFRSYPRWIAPFSNKRERVLESIRSVSLVEGVQDRDKRRDVSKLVEDIHTLCSDTGRAGDRNSRGRGGVGGNAPATDQQSCAYNLAEGQVQQWDAETRETLDTLRSLTGQLAAVPGRKMVIMFSEGWVTDPSTAGAQAMVAVFGIGVVDMQNVVWSFDRNSSTELQLLHQTAKAADVSFFTIDTTRGYDSGFGGQLERGQSLAYQRSGVNPWSEMNWDTRQTMSALAKETGGRSYYGTKELNKKIAAAADTYFGYYLVGYYRSSPTAAAGKVKVKISRPKLDIGYPDKPTLWPHRPNPIRLDLSVGRPTPNIVGEGQLVPLRLTMNLTDIPLRRGAGGRGAQVGVFVQAIKPDGAVASERLDVETVYLERGNGRESIGKSYVHFTELSLLDGPYRILARISDDRQNVVGQRAFDMTVVKGEISAGIVTATTDSE